MKKYLLISIIFLFCFTLVNAQAFTDSTNTKDNVKSFSDYNTKDKIVVLKIPGLHLQILREQSWHDAAGLFREIISKNGSIAIYPPEEIFWVNGKEYQNLEGNFRIYKRSK